MTCIDESWGAGLPRRYNLADDFLSDGSGQGTGDGNRLGHGDGGGSGDGSGNANCSGGWPHTAAATARAPGGCA